MQVAVTENTPAITDTTYSVERSRRYVMTIGYRTVIYLCLVDDMTDLDCYDIGLNNLRLMTVARPMGGWFNEGCRVLRRGMPGYKEGISRAKSVMGDCLRCSFGSPVGVRGGYNPTDDELQRRVSQFRAEESSYLEAVRILDRCPDLNEAINEKFGRFFEDDIDPASTNQEMWKLLDDFEKMVEFFEDNREKYCG